MDEQTAPSPEYLKGFNEGYVLAKEAPDLANKLSSLKSDSERTQGFQDGRKEFVMEKVKSHRQGLFKSSQERSTNDRQDRGLDIDRDR